MFPQLGDVAYHDLAATNEAEKESIARDIEGSAKVRNLLIMTAQTLILYVVVSDIII